MSQALSFGQDSNCTVSKRVIDVPTPIRIDTLRCNKGITTVYRATVERQTLGHDRAH
jgi:hypothetical protein